MVEILVNQFGDGEATPAVGGSGSGTEQTTQHQGAVALPQPLGESLGDQRGQGLERVIRPHHPPDGRGLDRWRRWRRDIARGELVSGGMRAGNWSEFGRHPCLTNLVRH